jgi:GNAT superfamily N-acetyltransferase
VLMETVPVRMSPAGFKAFMAALSGPATAVPEIVELFRRRAPWEASGSKTGSWGLAISGPELLTAAHDLAEFSCGKPSLDRWLKTRALSNQEKRFTAVLVVHEANRVIGYYGLAPTAIVPSILPRSIRTGQPPDPVPCLLLGQLATDQDWIGKGIGTGLLKHALQRCVTAADLIGGRALIVNAVDVEAAAFWKRHGFIPSKDDPLILFRSIADIAASLR